jgi:hypothetical protein
MNNWESNQYKKRKRQDAVSMALVALLLIVCAYIYALSQGVRDAGGATTKEVQYAVQR